MNSTTNAQSAQQAPRYVIPISTRLPGKRHVLIDGVDEYTADAVVARFGGKGDKFHWLQDVRKDVEGEE